ncbi:MAG: hypothetical protein IJI41_10035 [Anaerolineaceae bacterium]|nr:hypothetical protein [Anaerolineaceae bacterium]
MATKLSTRIILQDNVTKKDFQNLCLDWVAFGKNYPKGLITEEFRKNIDADYRVNNMKNASVHFRNLKTQSGKSDFFAFRFKIIDERSVTWCTDAVYSDLDGIKSVLIQINPTALHYEKIPIPKVPHLVSLMIKRGFCAEDGGLPVDGKPLEVSISDLDMCADIINGVSDNILPVVYLSKDFWGVAANSEQLANELKGVAHVLVESNIDMGKKLRKMTNNRNVFGSYIGVYFPKTKYYKKYSLSFYDQNVGWMLDDLKQWLFIHFSSGEMHNRYTWTHISFLQTAYKGNATEKELEEFIQNFDTDENNEGMLQNEIDELSKENSDLRIENEALRKHLEAKNIGTDDTPFFNRGTESDLYPGEFSDLLIYILRQVQNRYLGNSRPRHMIDSMLNANKLTGENERVINGLENLLTNGHRLTQQDKRELENLGFNVSEQTHYRVTYHGDERYKGTIPKTPSDWRGGRNNFSQFCKLLDLDQKIK